MQKRTASVNKVRIHGITNSAVFNIGDTKMARPKSRGIAVQKEGASFTGDDGVYFNNYSLFHRKAKWPAAGIPVLKNTFHHCGSIEVDTIRIIGVSQAAIFQIGSINHVRGEARVKHFRRYSPE